MKEEKEQILSGFEYSIIKPGSTICEKENSVRNHSHQMQIKIDFRNGKFSLHGYSQYLMERNECRDEKFVDCYTNRININMSLYPKGTINLEDFATDGNVLFLSGTLKDEYQSNHCTGMLIFSRNHSRSADSPCNWLMIVYVYECNNAFVEFKFTLPVYLNTLKLPSNLFFPC